jgi:hypothetical protein
MDESFKTGTGLADSLDLHIQDAAFVLDPSYGRDGELIPLLKMTGTATIDGVEKPLSETWPVGGGWQVADDGAKIVSAKNTKVNANTDYGRFIDAFVVLPQAAEILDKIDGSAFEAATWVGFTLHLDRASFPYSFKDRDTGEKIEGVKRVLLPHRADRPRHGRPAGAGRGGPEADPWGEGVQGRRGAGGVR